MAEPLQYLLITVKVVALEKVSFGDTQSPRLFLNRLTVNGKHYLLNRENLRQQIHNANGSKHCWNLNSNSFTIFINHCEGSYIGKSLF